MSKRVLILGGTGAIGLYTVPELLNQGYLVDVTSRSSRESSDDKLEYITGNAKNITFLKSTIESKNYDVVIDFMNYKTVEFEERYRYFLSKCKQYIFLSSYRVFADQKPLTEKSPKLIDVSNDIDYLDTDDYSLAKARQERLLINSGYNNWTIIRPAITYSKERFQFGTHELETSVWRAINGLPTIIPTQMLNKLTTMTWAGDVAKMIAGLTLNKKAIGEDFILATNEYHTWFEVADIYKELIGLKVKAVDKNKYIKAMGGGLVKYQVNNDRMYDRVIDNTKILETVGINQQQLKSLKAGLELELGRFIKNPNFPKINYERQARIDRLVKSCIPLENADESQKKVYFKYRYPTKSYIRDVRGHKDSIASLPLKIKNSTRIRTRSRELIRSSKEWHNLKKFDRPEGAIITLSGYFNYGNILQRYALQEFLYQNKMYFVSLYNIQKESPLNDINRTANIRDFVKNRIVTRVFSNNKKYSTYLVGSDQIWRNWTYSNPKKDLGYYFVNFDKSKKSKKIAYAASFGLEDTNEIFKHNELSRYLKKFVTEFNSISFREQSGSNIAKTIWGIDSKVVVDPVMLLKPKDYNMLINRSPKNLQKTPNIFAYLVRSNANKLNYIKNISEKNDKNAEIITLADDELKPVEHWLKGFRDSKLVITDSFHGVVLAIIYNTPFVVIDSEYGGTSRLDHLLSVFNLTNRLVKESNLDNLNLDSNDIDWRSVNKKIKMLRKGSSRWLLTALRN